MADEITGAIDRRYDTLRKRTEQESRAGTQQQQDMLKRQFARMGGGPSGAHVKQSMLAEDRGQKQMQKAREGIDMQKNAEMQRRMEVLEGRKYQTGEREAGQEFSAKQADIQRGWQTGERKAGEGFQEKLWQKNFDAVIAPKLELAMKQFGLEETAQAANQKLQISEAIKRGLDGYSYEDLAPHIGEYGVSSLYARDAGISDWSKASYNKMKDGFHGMQTPSMDNRGSWADSFRNVPIIKYSPHGSAFPGSGRYKNIADPTRWSW